MANAKAGPPEVPPARNLSKKDVIAAYGSERKVADAMGVTIQAINRWPRFIPRQRVWQAIAQHPELEAKVILVPVKFKKVERTVVRYVKVAA